DGRRAGAVIAARAEPYETEHQNERAGNGKESGDGLGHDGDGLPLLRRLNFGDRQMGAYFLPANLARKSCPMNHRVKRPSWAESPRPCGRFPEPAPAMPVAPPAP